MNDKIADALLFIAPGCPHCPAVLSGLSELVKQGLIGRLEVINVAIHPERAEALKVRSAPWCRIGPFVLEGARRPAELKRWAELAARGEGFADYIQELLDDGRLHEAERALQEEPSRLADLLPLLEDLKLSIHVRLGLAALFEEQAGSDTLRALVPRLGELSRHADHRVRSDACHYLGLSGSPQAVDYLRVRTEDEHPEVREIAVEALEEFEAVDH